ncbi:BAG family molecular chaperone regulator 1 [Linum grandiflorum]
MMRMKTKSTLFTNGVPAPVPPDSGRAEWELRPGGMLVQKRNPDSDHRSIPPPTIRVRVKYGSITHEISISSQSTFGELKKMLTGPTGLNHQDQKLFYKDKERDSKAFLDITGVKDKSRVVLIEDPMSQERRYVEMRKNAKLEKASKSISEISLEVDRLAGRVSALELVIGKGGKVAEKDVLGLIELLMNELLKLDGIMGDGDVKLQRKMQVKRVQKYVETLDMLKVKNSMPNGTQKQHQTRQANGHNRLAPIEEHPPPPPQQQQQHEHHHRQQHQQPARHSNSGPVVVTTQWETFDSTPPPPSIGTSTMANNNSVGQQQPKFPWEFFG